jgi:hypothetical protein
MTAQEGAARSTVVATRIFGQKGNRQMTKTIARKVMWVGRATVFTVGLAITLALILGVAATALAAVPGDPFKLGRINRIDGLSTLVGSADGALLRINNEGSGPAIDLRVEEGEVPMNVNSTTRVNDLNADRVDGKDSTAFVPAETYEVQKSTLGEGEGQQGNRIANCDRGDVLLGGGFVTSSPEDDVLSNQPTEESGVSGWFFGFQDNGPRTIQTAYALCADLSPLRP